MAAKTGTVSLAIALVFAAFTTGSTWALSDISESGTLRRWKDLGQVYERLGRRHDAVREYRAFSKASRKLAAGYLHRYSEKPDDTKSRVEKLGYRL